MFDLIEDDQDYIEHVSLDAMLNRQKTIQYAKMQTPYLNKLFQSMSKVYHGYRKSAQICGK